MNQFIPVTKIPMIQEGGAWAGDIPAGAYDRQWDIMYYFEAVDIYGSGVIRPDFREETPYHVIKIDR